MKLLIFWDPAIDDALALIYALLHPEMPHIALGFDYDHFLQEVFQVLTRPI